MVASFALAPVALDINPNRWPAIVTLTLLTLAALVRCGPFVANVVCGSMRASTFLRVRGLWLLIGSPFTRRARLDDLSSIKVKHAPGDVFRYLIELKHSQGTTSFIADVSDQGADVLVEKLRTLSQAHPGNAR